MKGWAWAWSAHSLNPLLNFGVTEESGFYYTGKDLEHADQQQIVSLE